MDKIPCLLLANHIFLAKIPLTALRSRRSKLCIACSDFFHFISKVRARSLRCSSSPNRTRCAGLRFGLGGHPNSLPLLFSLHDVCRAFYFGFRSLRSLHPSALKFSGRSEWSGQKKNGDTDCLGRFRVTILFCINDCDDQDSSSLSSASSLPLTLLNSSSS